MLALCALLAALSAAPGAALAPGDCAALGKGSRAPGVAGGWGIRRGRSRSGWGWRWRETGTSKGSVVAPLFCVYLRCPRAPVARAGLIPLRGWVRPLLRAAALGSVCASVAT